VRLRAFGNYAFRVTDPKLFHTEISGTREEYTVADVEGQLRGLVLQNISNAIACQRHPVPGPGGQPDRICQGIAHPAWPRDGQAGPEARRHDGAKRLAARRAAEDLDQKIGMGMVGNDMGKFMQYQTAQSIPKFAEGGAAVAVALRAMPWAWAPAWRWARCWRKTCRPACRQHAQAAALRHRPRLAATLKPDDVMATLEKLGDLKAKGILTEEEFAAKKAELLKKLV
jgi:membrane protease subunit (stomatin/prohibitin family)